MPTPETPARAFHASADGVAASANSGDVILLVEDDIATREWLAGMLSSGPDAVRVVCFGTAADALVWLVGHRPDIVLIDLGLPDRPGTDVIRAAATRWPACDILVITIFGDESHVVAALEAGANGYLLKDSSLDNIREHLAYLRLGGSPMTPRIARMLIRQHRDTRLPSGESGLMPLDLVPPASGSVEPPGELSQREHEVLTGIAKGFSYAEVAGALNVTTNTVRSHIKNIYLKLSVNSRSEAVYEFNQRQALRGKPPLV
jgi:DNA-binding NarL/FixJ family response regulator